MTKFERIEASRLQRGAPDPTIGARPMPSLAVQPVKGVFKRSFYAWKSDPTARKAPPVFPAAAVPVEQVNGGPLRGDGKFFPGQLVTVTAKPGGGPGRGIGGMSPQKRQEISRKANAARWRR